MPAQYPSNGSRDDRAIDAAALCMYVFVQHAHPFQRAAEQEKTSLSQTTAMMLDLFDAATIPTERLAPDLIAAYPPDTRSAVNSFYLLGTLLNGFCPDSANQIKILALLRTAGSGALVTESTRHKSDLSPFLSDLPHSAFLLSEEIYQHAKDEPGLGFSKVSASGQIRGDGFYQLSPRGYLENSTLHSGSADSLPKRPIPRRPAQLARRLSMEDLPADLLLAVQKQPRTWTLSLGSTLAAALIVTAVLLIRPSPRPARSVSATPIATPVPAVEKPAAAPADMPRVESTPVPPPPAAVVPPPPPRSKGELKERDLREQDQAQAAQKEKPHVDVLYSQQDIQTLLIKADRFSGNGNYDQAIAYYKRVLRQDPQNAEANRGIKRALQNKAQ